LRKLGCKLVWNRTLMPLQAVTVLHTIKSVKKAGDGFHDKLERMTDNKHRARAILIDQMLHAAYNAPNIHLNVIFTCELVKMTLCYGVSEFSATCFVALSVFAELLRHIIEISKDGSNNAGGSKGAECAYSAHAYGLTWVGKLENSSIQRLNHIISA
jgi:hypothetical protein